VVVVAVVAESIFLIANFNLGCFSQNRDISRARTGCSASYTKIEQTLNYMFVQCVCVLNIVHTQYCSMNNKKQQKDEQPLCAMCKSSRDVSRVHLCRITGPSSTRMWLHYTTLRYFIYAVRSRNKHERQRAAHLQQCRSIKLSDIARADRA
jgi:hypothetical protein